MRNLKGLLGIFVASFLATGCSHQPTATSVKDIRVKTIVVEQTDLTGSRIYSGTIEEAEGSTLSFSVPGTLQKMYVSAGDRVAKGQLIGELDDASLRNAYDMAKATLDQAQDAYNRLAQLHDANSLPDIKWVEMESKLAQAKSAEAIAKRSLDDAKLYAPFSGYISEKFADLGSTVAPGVPVVKLVTINPVKVNVSIPENEISSISDGEVASITVGALGGKHFEGRLTEKAVSANPLSRSYNVKATLPNPTGELLPGMICEVVLSKPGEAVPAIVLPNRAVLLDANNNHFVWTVKDSKADKRQVVVEGMTDAGLVISSGIEPGDSVIVDGQQKVSQGIDVVIVNNK